MKKIGRNDPCHCGSGKKYKNCHEKLAPQKESRKKAILLGGIIGALIIIAILIMITTSQPTPDGAPGPAPPGKVWNEEHGHWHDV